MLSYLPSCRKQKFSILCDGGNDNFNKKYFGILVRLWDDRRREVVVRFLDIPVCNIATGETLFQALATALESRAILWENYIGFASDSASVMVGRRNSVLNRIRDRHLMFLVLVVCATLLPSVLLQH